MRIISGLYKARRITAPKSLPVRPTTDIAKEALFNILNNRFDFEIISVLDLFAGTGNISYEFASRGVKEIVCVDAHFGCVKFIKKTALEFSFPISTFKSDSHKYLSKTKQSFDIIFADPPYDLSEEKFENIVSLVFENTIVKENGLLIIEHSKHMDLETHPNFIEARKYGGSVFSFFK